MSDEGMDKLTRQAELAFQELQALDARIRVGCAMQRAREEAAPGTLGLHVVDSVRWMREDPEKLTILFKSAPRIGEVDPGSPAEKAGIRPGDVWISVNGQQLVGEVRMDELLMPGSTINSRIRRDGKEIDVGPMIVVKKISEYPSDICDSREGPGFDSPLMDVRKAIVAAPAIKPAPRPTTAPLPPRAIGTGPLIVMRADARTMFLGAVLQSLDADWRGLTGLQGEGLLVTELPTGAPALDVGIRKFDLIRQVNGEPATLAVFNKMMFANRSLVLTIFHKDEKGGTTRTVTIQR